MKKWTKKYLAEVFEEVWLAHSSYPDSSAVFQFILATKADTDSGKLMAIAHACDNRAFSDMEFIDILWLIYSRSKRKKK